MFGSGSEPCWFLASGTAHLFLPGMVLGMEWWLAASGGHGSGRPLMVLVPADGDAAREGGLPDWLSTGGLRGLGENPFLAMAGACDGGVRGRRDLPEGVDGILSYSLRGTTPGETPDPRVGRWRRVGVASLSRASILEFNPVRGTSWCVGRLVVCVGVAPRLLWQRRLGK